MNTLEITKMIKTFLDEDDWNYSFNDEHNFFYFSLNLKSKIQSAKYQIRIRECDYSVIVSLPITASDCLNEMADFITRANFGLLNGKFEMDFQDGEIRYSTFVNCDETTPGTQTIRDSIYIPAQMIDQYSSGILAIIFNNATAAEAIELSESNIKSERS